MLLEEGIGDTMRVSLTADPVEEIETAFMILSAVGLRQRGPEVISCPSCGRCDIDLIGLATTVESRVRALGTKIPLKVAVMGCEVNGPGEARDADVGIAGGLHEGLIFKKGEILRKVKEATIVDDLMEEVKKVLIEKEAAAAADAASAQEGS
jgi:(E)-4-hydroxy-3-methylbut-2-enyl-diphosphate synthase